MSIAQKLPKATPWCVQKCPLCNEEKIIVSRGLVNTEKGLAIIPDRGYSFCNCKNIWFTDWNNIDTKSRHENESIEVLHYFLSDITLVSSTGKYAEYTVREGIIHNQGYKKNNIYIVGDAPKTEEEFKRLGFVVRKPLGLCSYNDNLIWSYHTLEHEKDPISKLQEYYNTLAKDGILFIAMPDPFFIEFENTYNWKHWLIREHHIMWDMDSFCDEAIKIGFNILMTNRNTMVKPNKDMFIVLQK